MRILRDEPAGSLVSQGMARAVPEWRVVISWATVVMVERAELGSGGKGERDARAEGSVVDFAETTTVYQGVGTYISDVLLCDVVHNGEGVNNPYPRILSWPGQWLFGVLFREKHRSREPLACQWGRPLLVCLLKGPWC